MFDPTAFENMKVVVDGAIYDEDLSGGITIIDRNDFLNTAKLSRKYEVSFISKEDNRVVCTFIMEAGLENLAAELLPSAHSELLSGCQLFVKFSFLHPNERSYFQAIERCLKDIWGSERTISQSACFDPFDEGNRVKNETIIFFNRLVYEDQMDDILAMVKYMIVSMERLKTIV
ncbi:hypothetical protein [Cytobacillus praedii]|uniref:Group-specific protein n=1 Tax=Cytobacillus praedii TaxID=1742358 RepID=A0A4R1AYF3_9BACI|nr:hypothetical protein [Cytobacillus praedii]MED3553537.1 hypothetical protein [Cytobacillus praedii]TCJ05406.1 hypothetical protein E0Y62_04450 [Cytobacillus praedii]